MDQKKPLKQRIGELNRRLNGNLFEALKVFGSGTLGAALVAGIAWGSMETKVNRLEENQIAFRDFQLTTEVRLTVSEETTLVRLDRIYDRLSKIEEKLDEK